MTVDDQRLLSLLRNLDDPEHWEFPRDYDHVATRARFDRLAGDIDQAFDCACSVDRGVQDASFHGDIVIPAIATKSRDLVVVRFSNFGSLITAGAGGVRADTPEPAGGLHDEDRSRIKAAAEALDCVWMPRHLLRKRYGGSTEMDDWQRLWWHRFFDYM
ncbi:hypothetical protein AB0D45_00455 [Streptomyces sp. NPDC048352]|uniref:hypothetical protein n=1 Tax=Streptomyces sp. NPDC048352 TaxID=3154718 RepID=UPI003421B61D